MAWSDQVIASPALYPLSYDAVGGRVRWVRLDEAAYRDASFLDERILPKTGEGDWVSLDSVAAVSQDVRAQSDFIFHMGHVGSTLLSRILATDDRVFSLREPAILRTLADRSQTAIRQSDVETFGRLFARVWRPEQRALVKATSFVTDIAPQLMDVFPAGKAILMFAPPVAYMSGMLAGSATRPELTTGAKPRLTRLHHRLGASIWDAEDLSEGECAAMAWVGEIVALADVARRYPSRTMWLDFEAFLARPEAGLTACLRFLQGTVSQAMLNVMLVSRDFGRYSKAVDHVYDARTRAEILARGQIQHRAEIERGLQWLNTAGRRYALIADSTRTAAGSRQIG